MRLSFLILSCTLFCVGCATSIKVTRLSPNDPAPVGVPWNLPMTQFKIAITRHVTQCWPELKGSVEVIATTALAVDTAQRYLLTSKGQFATSDISATLSAGGFNTGLNASSVGATSTIISNIVGTVSQLALFHAATGPAVASGLAVTRTVPKNVLDEVVVTALPVICSPVTDVAVTHLYPSDQKGGLKAVVEKETADLADSTARLALLTAKKVTDDNVKKILSDALIEQDRLEVKLESDQRALADNLKRTTNTVTVTWPALGTQFVTETPFQIDQGKLTHWLKEGIEPPKSILVKFGVHAAIYRFNASDGTWSLPDIPATKEGKPATKHEKQVTVDTSVGIPVRLAGAGRLLVCVSAECPYSLDVNFTPNDDQISSDFPILQLGQVYVLPVTGGGFKSESAVVTLDVSGLPTQLQTSEKASAVAGITGAAKDASTQLAALPASIRAAELAKTQAETNQLTANANLAAAQASSGIQGNTATLNAQAAFITAQNNLAVAQKNAGITVSTAEITAQSNLISAQSTLVTAQANAGVVDETSVLGAQTALVNAQAALINANSALAKAQSVVP